MQKKNSQSKKNLDMESLLMDQEKLLMSWTDLGLQWGDILGLTHAYLMVHCPGGREEYEEGGHPEFYYGPRRN